MSPLPGNEGKQKLSVRRSGKVVKPTFKIKNLSKIFPTRGGKKTKDQEGLKNELTKRNGKLSAIQLNKLSKDFVQSKNNRKESK